MQAPKEFNNNWDVRVWWGCSDQNCQAAPGPVSVICHNKYFYMVMNDITFSEKSKRDSLFLYKESI